MTRFPKLSLILCSLVLLAACGHGTKVDWNQARKVQVGTTKEELVQLLGRPYSIRTVGDREMWIWTHVNGFTGSHDTLSFPMKDGKVAAVPTIPAEIK